MRFDHIGLVVRTLAKGRKVLEETVGVETWTEVFEDPVNGVYVQFGHDGSGVCYELIQPLGDDSPVREALASRRTILNHVAYLVPDLEAAAARLRDTGSAPTGDPKPAIAYGGRRIQFFVTPLWFIMELIEAPDHRHAYGWQGPAGIPEDSSTKS